MGPGTTLDPYPPTELLVLSRIDEDQLVNAAVRGGVKGYLAKDHSWSRPGTRWRAATTCWPRAGR